MGGEESTAGNSELDQLLADCLERIDRGENPDPDSLINQYPQHAEGLRAFFIGNAQLEQMRQTGGIGPSSNSDHRTGEYAAGDEIQGRYRLLQLIGEGGMGAVWLAQQTTPVKRRVAIKLIRAGMDSKLVLARFDAERQALAMMDHPNIARVYDGGMTERGRPFFVMEYLRGTPLTDYCDRARLSVRDRMELFLQVCRAVQHAHTKGIVHRDLKPSNILVCQYDGRPVTKVIDFGLAKALNQDLTDLTLHTAHGVMVGTPIYMSPEQAELNNLDLDTRTDVYSLGVVLYELLTGTTPLDRDRLQRAAMQEVLRLIREEDPIPPSTRLSSNDRLPLIAAQRNVDPSALRNSVIGDLDWIVMKAIEKERNRRYETVVGLAEDIQRFLTDDVVKARPPGLLYRLSRLTRRHRVRMLAVGAVLTGVLAAAVGLGWGWKKSTQASTQLQQSISQMQTERGEKQRAQDAEQQQRELADRVLAEGILRSIGLSGYEDSIGISGEFSQAEIAALRAWASLPNDSQRIRVLEIGLSDATSARQLAARPISVLRACVGLSAVRRESVLKLLAEKQRCVECVPEVRGVSCLLTAGLGGTNLQALADVGSLKVPLQEFQKNIWRILPELPAEDRNRLLEFLLTPDSSIQSAAVQMQYNADEFVLDDAVKDSAELVWKRIFSDMQTKLATLKTDVGYDLLQVPNEELLPSVIKSLPEAMIPGAVSQILDLIEARPRGVPHDILSLILQQEPYLQLLQRLTVTDAALTAQRIVGKLTIDDNENRISMATAYLEILLPKLSAADIGAVRRQLFTILPDTQTWHTSSRWKLAKLLEQCISQLPPGELEPMIGEVLQLTDQGQLPTIQEVLSPVIVKLTPLMTQAQVQKLWNDLLTTMRNAEPSEQSEWWMVVMAYPLANLANRLDAAMAVTAASDLLALPHLTERPLVTMPAVMTTLNVLLEHLNAAQLATLKLELMTPLHSAELDLMTPQNSAAAAPDPIVQQTAFRYSVSVSSLLEHTFRLADPLDDGEFLQWLQTMNYRDENFHSIAAIAVPTLELVLSRTDRTLMPAIFESLLTSLREIDTNGVQSYNAAIAASGLLRASVRNLDSPYRSGVWSALMDFLKPVGDPIEFNQLREQSYAILVAPALRLLALQVSEDQCESHLRRLIEVLQHESPNVVLVTPQHFSVSLFAGVSEPLAARMSAPAARSFVTWLNQKSTGVADNIRSLALQAVIPRLDDQQIAVVWDELFAQILVSGSPEIGAIPFRELAVRLTREQSEIRWNATLDELRKTRDPILPGRLSGILMALLPHVSDELKNAAVDPLSHALQLASQTLQRSDSHVHTVNPYDDRTERAVLAIADQLDASSRYRLAEANLRLLLEFREPYSGILQSDLTLAASSNDPRQIARFLCHPAASSTMLNKLLRRLEELVLLGGRSLDPDENKISPFSDQYGMDPDLRKIETIDALVDRTLQGDAGQAERLELPARPVYPRRRFITIYDAAEWMRENWTDFNPDKLAAESATVPNEASEPPAAAVGL